MNENKKNEVNLLAIMGLAIVLLLGICLMAILFFGGAEKKNPQGNPVETENTELENSESEDNEMQESEESENIENSEEIVQEVLAMTIPDPCMFLGCQKNDSHETNDGEAWMVGCTFSIDGAEEALNELMELLLSEDYKLKLIDSEEEDYIGTSAQYFYYFYFDYTGEEPEVEGFEYFTGVISDVVLQVVFNYSSGSVDLRMRHDDALTLVDSQKQATILPESYSGTYTPGSNSDSNDYYKPDHSKLDCTFCNDGDCPKCNGYGKVEYYNGGGDYVDSVCPECHGNRKCRHCNGTGKREN